MDFSECLKKFGVNGKISLRRYQFSSAKKGNTAMLIWLGKQYLNQSEKVEQVTFDATNINDLNKKMVTTVLENRNIEDFE